MSAAIRRFINRAPRYVLKPTDNQVMRFATDQGPAGVFKTTLVNLSESGAAFVVDRSMTPQIGDTIKVELPIPGLDQIAWYGQVRRMESYATGSWWSDPDPFADDEKLLIGIQFHELPEGHRLAIQKGLQEQFLKELKERRQRQQLFLKNWIAEHMFKFLGYLILTLLSFGLLFYLSRPSANYDAQRGAPWGERFKNF